MANLTTRTQDNTPALTDQIYSIKSPFGPTDDRKVALEDLKRLVMTTASDPATNAAVSTAILDANEGTVITLTAAGNSQTLQTPTDTTAGKVFVVINNNTSTDTISVNSVVLQAGDLAYFVWDGSAWISSEPQDGFVTGPASSTDNAITRFDGTTGKIVQNSAVTVDDSGNITGVGTLSTGAQTVSVSGATTGVDITQSGSGTSLNINNSGSGDFVVVNTNDFVIPNSGAITSDRNVTITGDLSATNLTGTLQTAAQPNITSVGTLTSATVSGDLTVDTDTLFVDSSNNRVGIGTTSPTDKFHIDGFSFGGRALFKNSSGGSSAGFRLSASTNTPTEVSFVDMQVTNGTSGNETSELSFGTINGGSLTEKMRITAAGNVGIGTTSPDERLEISGGSPSASTNNFPLKISTDNAAADLRVGVFFQPSTAVEGYGIQGINSGASSGHLGFYSVVGGTPTERARFDANGSLLIGKTTLQTGGASLQTVNSSGDGQYYAGNAAGTGWIFGRDNATTGDFLIGDVLNDADSTVSERFRLTTAGKVTTGRLTLDDGTNTNIIEGGISSVASIDMRNGGTGFMTFENPFGYIYETSNTERMRMNASGNVQIGTTTEQGRLHVSSSGTAEGTEIARFSDGTPTAMARFFASNSGTQGNAANCVLNLSAASSTSRSINAAGTVNASGADYAEFEKLAEGVSPDDVAKGDIIGFDVNGDVTRVFADSISFAVKSTNPSYVGGDTWGGEDNVGVQPVKPEEVQEPVLVEEPAIVEEPVVVQKPTVEITEEGEDVTDYTQYNEYLSQKDAYKQYIIDKNEYDSYLLHKANYDKYIADLAVYEAEFPVWEENYHKVRRQYDRIAYSGKVPVNIPEGATFNVGDWVIPQEGADGKIEGLVVSNEDLTFEQMKSTVGRVQATYEDGRPVIKVK